MFKNAERVGLQELGPRFTLKLRSLQKGTFDSKFGEYEWVMVRPTNIFLYSACFYCLFVLKSSDCRGVVFVTGQILCTSRGRFMPPPFRGECEERKVTCPYP